MKQNKLLLLSLLASFLLLISASYATAQNAVTFGTVDVCPQPAGGKVLVPVLVTNGVDLAALDIIGKVISDGNVDLVVTGITFDNRMGLPETLDKRYPIGDLGGGIFRLGAAKLLENAPLWAGNGQIATLELEYVSDCLLGSAALDPAEFDCNLRTWENLFVDQTAVAITPTVNSGAVNVVNSDPFFTFCPDDYTIYWGESVTVQLLADDPDLDCGCDALTFTKIIGPGLINGSTGVYQFVAGAGNIGCNPVQIKVSDTYGGEALCDFNINVLNKPPVITCPDEVFNILWGQTVTATVTAEDPDFGPLGLTYSLIDPGSYPGSPDIDPETGVFTWVTGADNAFLGLWEFCVIVTDGAKIDACNLENADTCCFYVHVDPKFQVAIEKVHDQLQGHYVDIHITTPDWYESMPMGGFDFLIAYDASALAFVEANPGQLLVDCNWEYFTYRFGPFGNCGDACPSGMLRIVALAETNNGANHPDCFTTASGTELAVLTFFVSNDRTYECMYAPIYFYWMDCGDNVISSRYGDTLFLEDKVYDFEGYDITFHPGTFPSATGTLDACLEGAKLYPLRAIDFKNGGVDIVCADSIDKRGDINVNGMANEIADAVMFTNYFINGLSAFGTHIEASIAASDVNADGITLSVADLVYLIRVIQGDASPYVKDGAAAPFAVRTQLMNQQMTVSYTAGENVGAAFLRFKFDGTIGDLKLGDGAAGMDVKYGVDGDLLNVLIFNLKSGAIASGDHVMLTIDVKGDMKLTQVDAADYFGNAMEVSMHVLPSEFGLAQNYPNPFNPKTTIALALPVASDYTVAIYNIAGQLIRTYSGYANAGVVSIVWDGTDASGNQVASGMYFYKAQASQFSATKKMVLMK
jgi:hypothetical protein